jgi:hypothetical protein
MKLITALVLSVSLTGCAAIQEWIPSFWDDNQSAKIIDIRQKAHNIDCTDVITQKYWSSALARDIQWFELYSDSKGSAQKDVLRMIEPMKKTVAEWDGRENPSKAYCELKKKIIKVQADKAANAVHWRF